MWVIPRVVVNKILGHAQRSAPKECVGLLSGHGKEASHWHPLTNTVTSNDRFFADPQELIDRLKTIREEGRDLVAIYHSHPEGSTTPSATDLTEANYPEALHLIISMDTKGRLEMEGYRIESGQASRQDIEITG